MLCAEVEGKGNWKSCVHQLRLVVYAVIYRVLQGFIPIFTPTKMNIEPKNDGLVQMNFLFISGCILRFQPLVLRGVQVVFLFCHGNKLKYVEIVYFEKIE